MRMRNISKVMTFQIKLHCWYLDYKRNWVKGVKKTIAKLDQCSNWKIWGMLKSCVLDLIDSHYWDNLHAF